MFYNLVNSSIRMFVKKSGLMAKSDISDFPIVENLLKDARGARSDCQERTGAGRPQVCWVRVISVVMREHQARDAVLDIELAGRSEDIDQDWRWDETVLPL